MNQQGQDFQDKVVLITGGTRGIGKALALRLASEGARLAMNYLSRTDQAEQTLKELESAGGQGVIVPGDVSTPESAEQIVASNREQLGPIDMLVTAAGISIPGSANAMTWERWKTTHNINLDGTFSMIYAVKDEMIKRGFGRIVTFSSIAGLRERENQVAYSSSKAAVIA
ncbi:MAG: SDR family oxidoreductase, partial [Pirellulaceae bacterium]